MKVLYLTIILSISYQLNASSNAIDCTSEIDTAYFNSAYFKNREIIFSSSKADLELKNLMTKRLNITGVLSLKDLDSLFEWDRINNMKYIYKILDLMDRNYLINKKNVEDFLKYEAEFNSHCEGLNHNV
ncbi:hypothetical protein OAH66_01770 [Gammaproteobacteria bacterium]|nr:hypothetical protein [Gammaproteobacteria bacterium]MDB4591814.1 hypothetical protein [Gammaproteobacteria bacterium]